MRAGTATIRQPVLIKFFGLFCKTGFLEVVRILLRGLEALGADFYSFAVAQIKPLQIRVLFLFNCGIIVAAQ